MVRPIGPQDNDQIPFVLLEFGLVGLLCVGVGAFVPDRAGQGTATLGLLVILGAAGVYAARVRRW